VPDIRIARKAAAFQKGNIIMGREVLPITAIYFYQVSE
jgi:hypothetical protein